MRKFRQELFVMTAENNLYDKDYINYRNMFVYRKGYKISFHKYEDALPIIIDKFKTLFGLNSMDRNIVIFPSQDKYYIESHKGYERFIESSEVNSYEIFKIRVFRWMVGLPHYFPQKDIIVRIQDGKKSFISYKDNDIDFEREIRIDNSSPEYNFDDCMKEMVFGLTSCGLKKDLKKIIEKIDAKYIFLSDFIVKRLHQHGYL